jgi:ABC-2 type transport system ATP-binding protein
MYRGKIIALGAPADLKKSLASHTLFQLNTSDPLESMKVLGELEGILDVAVFGAGLHVMVDNPAVFRPRIEQAITRRGIAIHQLESIPPSMEDVFVAMIEQEERRTA